MLCCMQMEEGDVSSPDDQPYPAQHALQGQHPGNPFAAGNTPRAIADHVATPFRVPLANFSSPMAMSLRGQAMPGKQAVLLEEITEEGQSPHSICSTFLCCGCAMRRDEIKKQAAVSHRLSFKM